MHGSGRGQHVAGVREGRERGHVTRQSGRAERTVLFHQAFGEIIHVMGLFALLGLAGHLPVSGLDALFLHGEWSVDLRGEKRQMLIMATGPSCLHKTGA